MYPRMLFDQARKSALLILGPSQPNFAGQSEQNNVKLFEKQAKNLKTSFTIHL